MWSRTVVPACGHGHEYRLGARPAVLDERADAREVLGVIAVENASWVRPP
jgi:hypothetical protein